ncbi:sprT domain-containing protein [Salinadaptatus halalkaliphilus]|uniref:SprT domain-containing protein n=1 Tax=Salinadaptatus halalkaliphilus TaxID=2419781 RepID=A0A4V3VKS1_9EURY|nr:SprT-like domain-containing protein [Salinadaptatus halalkaliphilus]THE62827.1 sprT domain-containing protein [Salinadaptatus halalkaliphilus]
MSDAEYTLEDELLARARIHAREVVDDHGLEIDLSSVEWDVSKRATRRAGACRWESDREVATIVLTRRAYERYEWPEFAAVLRHELVHVWQFQRFGEAGHGPQFREQAELLSAPRHCPTFSEPRYVLRCLESGCDWRAQRHQASEPVKTPEQYRCGVCSGEYEVEHVESGRTWTTAGGFGGAKAALGSQW